MSPALHLYQIVTSAGAASEPGYIPLAPDADAPPGWAAWRAMRRTLRGQPLDEQAFYGFFPQGMAEQTGFRHADIVDFLQRPAGVADVALFSPRPQDLARHRNIFFWAEQFQPGLMDTCRAWLHTAGLQVTPEAFVMGPRQMVFGNAFAASPPFWRLWLALAEHLAATCEGPAGMLRQQLARPTAYAGGAQACVLVLECLASLMLALGPHWRVRVADPFRHMCLPPRGVGELELSTIGASALKHAYTMQTFDEYLGAFQRQQRLAADGVS